MGFGLGQGLAEGLKVGIGAAEDQQRLQLEQAKLSQDREDRKRQFGLQQQEVQQRSDTADFEALSKASDLTEKDYEDASNAYRDAQDSHDQDAIAALRPQLDTLTARRANLRSRIQDHVLKPIQQRAADTAQKWKSGEEDPANSDPKDATVALAVATHRNPKDLISNPDGTPSPVAKAYKDLVDNAGKGDFSGAPQALNVAFDNFLTVGKHEIAHHDNPDGSVVSGKIVKKEFDPKNPYVQLDPNDPDKIALNLKVTVSDGKGGTATYTAPVTQHRTALPDDPVEVFSAKSLMGQIIDRNKAISAINNTPLKDKVEEGMKDPSVQKDVKAVVDHQPMLHSDTRKRDFTATGISGGGLAVVDGRTGKVNIALKPTPRTGTTGMSAAMIAAQNEYDRARQDNDVVGQQSALADITSLSRADKGKDGVDLAEARKQAHLIASKYPGLGVTVDNNGNPTFTGDPDAVSKANDEINKSIGGVVPPTPMPKITLAPDAQAYADQVRADVTNKKYDQATAQSKLAAYLRQSAKKAAAAKTGK